MSYLIENFEGIQVLISDNLLSPDGSEFVIVDESEGYSTTSGMSENLKKQVVGIKDVITAVSTAFTKKMKSLGEYAPSEVQIELSLELEKEIGIWCIAGKGKFATTIKLIWKNEN